MYGGEQYVRSSAANGCGENLQSDAVQGSIDRWGRDMNVCKKKYRPFDVRQEEVEDGSGRVKVTVTRMYGCAYHSGVRRERIKRGGVREGWHDYGRWSREKAYKRAREWVKGERDGTGGREELDRFVCKDGMCARRKKNPANSIRVKEDAVRDEILSDDEEEGEPKKK